MSEASQQSVPTVPTIPLCTACQCVQHEGKLCEPCVEVGKVCNKYHGKTVSGADPDWVKYREGMKRIEQAQTAQQNAAAASTRQLAAEARGAAGRAIKAVVAPDVVSSLLHELAEACHGAPAAERAVAAVLRSYGLES